MVEVKELLQPRKSKSLSIAKEQNLDGDGLINLAGSGSLYLKFSPKNVNPETPSTSALSNDMWTYCPSLLETW